MRITLVLLTLLSQTAFSQFYTIDLDKPLERIEIGNRYETSSEFLGQMVTFEISLPKDFGTEQHINYPVIFVFDEQFFELTTGIVRHLSSVSRMPKSIVVSFSSNFSFPKTYMNGSKYLSTSWETMPSQILHSDNFVDFMEIEFIPFMKANFRTADYNIALSFSSSAILPFYSLAKWPTLFQAYIAINAGGFLGMGPEKDVNFIDLFEQRFKENPDQKANLFVASANADADVNYTTQVQDNLEDLAKRLSPYQNHNLKLISKVYENEEHYDISLKAIPEALEMIFPKERWLPKYFEMIKEDGDALENIDKHYSSLSEEYGFEMRPIATRWNNGNNLESIGDYLIGHKRIPEGIAILKRITEYFPNSVGAQMRLAYGYERNKEFNEAKAILEKVETMLDEDNSGVWHTQIQRIRERMEQ